MGKSNEVRNGVGTRAAPGMAPAEATRGEQPAPSGSVPADGFQRVLRTGRREAAGSVWTEQQGLGRGNHPAVSQQGRNEERAERIHAEVSGVEAAVRAGGWESFNNRDWRKAIRKSRSTSAKLRSTMDFRATRTAETGLVNSRR